MAVVTRFRNLGARVTGWFIPSENATPPESNAPTAKSAAELGRIDREFSGALTAGGIVFLIAYALPIIFPIRLPHEIVLLCEIVMWVLWAAFAIDFAVKFFLAPKKLRFIKHNLLDFITLAVPMMRPLRALMAVERFSAFAGVSLRKKWLTYVAAGAAMAVLIGSLAVTEAERRDPHGELIYWPSAVMWAFEAVTGVGFGAHQVVSAEGQVIGVILMLAGIVLVGFIVAAISSWFIENHAQQSRDLMAPATIGQVERVMEQNELIMAALKIETKTPENEGSAQWAHPLTSQ
jgi:voltage-gated potassium channel